MVRQEGIDFDGNHSRGARQQSGGQSAAAGSNLDDDAAGLRTSCGGDALQDRAFDQEMLTEFLPRQLGPVSSAYCGAGRPGAERF
jgi:hypothetical protein